MERTKNLYLASQFFRAMYFAWPIWFGYASLELNPIQIGFFFSLLTLFQLLFDIPTGAFADKFGRKKSAIIGNALLIIAPLLIAFGHQFNYYIVAAAFYGIGRSFTNGSLDALLYDSAEISTDIYKEIISKNVIFFQSGLLLSAFASGFLYEYDNTLPFIAEALASLICTLLIMLMKEDKSSQTDIKISYYTPIKLGLKEIFHSKFLKIFILFNIPLSLILSVSNDYLNEAAMIANNIDPIYRSILITSIKIIGLLTFYLFVIKTVKSNRHRIAFLVFFTLLSLSILTINSLPTFIIGYFILNFIISIQSAFVNPILNSKISSLNRTTTLSSISTLSNFAKLFSTMLFSTVLYFAGTNGVYAAFLVLAMVLIVPSGIWLFKHLEIEN